jgi:hypothetical protein
MAGHGDLAREEGEGVGKGRRGEGAQLWGRHEEGESRRRGHHGDSACCFVVFCALYVRKNLS